MIQNYRTYAQHQIAMLLILFLALVSCTHDGDKDDSAGYAHVSLFVSTASSGVNQDTKNWEDRVDELRMIVFDTQSGKAVFNEKLYFPNGFADKSRPVRLRPGQYDFYFIANETVYSGDFLSALMDVTTKTDFQSDARFTNLAYNPAFVPDGSTKSGRILMSAIYEDIKVTTGGTEENPLPLFSSATGVELIRSLAKVEVVFQKKISGETITKEKINAVALNNVAAVLSVPPYDDYYTNETVSSPLADLSGLNFGSDKIGTVIFYVPEFLTPQAASLCTELSINNLSYPIETANKNGINAQRRTVPELSKNSVIRNCHYIINVNVSSDDSDEIEIRVYVKPWEKEGYTYILGGGESVVLPPIYPTEESVIMPTVCGDYIEILYQNESLNLKDAYNYTVDYNTQTVTQGSGPYYCERKYGSGWRLIDACELMSYLAALDIANNVWMSNTWDMDTYNNSNPEAAIPLYSMPMRKAAQRFLENLTGVDLSDTRFVDETTAQPWEKDQISNKKNMGLIGEVFIPGDILYKPDEFQSGWWTGEIQEPWQLYESAFQIPAIWWSGGGYITLALKENWDNVLYTHFKRFDFNGFSRCVRTVK